MVDKLGWIPADFVPINEICMKTGGGRVFRQTQTRTYNYGSDTLTAWIKQILHRCLMCLGDLSRYMIEVYFNTSYILSVLNKMIYKFFYTYEIIEVEKYFRLI